MNDIIWKMISDSLNANGIDVFPPASHKLQCSKPYVVLKQDGTARIPGYSSERVYYRFMLYVPKEQYTYMDEFEQKVKNVLDTELFPLIMPSGSNDSDYYDDNYNAHLRQFLYHNNRRNKHL